MSCAYYTVFRCADCRADGPESWSTGRPCPNGCADDDGAVEINIPADEDGPECDVMIVCPDCGGSATLNRCPDCRRRARRRIPRAALELVVAAGRAAIAGLEEAGRAALRRLSRARSSAGAGPDRQRKGESRAKTP